MFYDVIHRNKTEERKKEKKSKKVPTARPGRKNSGKNPSNASSTWSKKNWSKIGEKVPKCTKKRYCNLRWNLTMWGHICHSRLIVSLFSNKVWISLDRLCLNLELEFWIEKNQGALIQTRSSDLRLRFGISIWKFLIRNRVIRNLGSGFGIVYWKNWDLGSAFIRSRILVLTRPVLVWL